MAQKNKHILTFCITSYTIIFMKVMQIIYYITIDGKCIYSDWLLSLDIVVQNKIIIQIERVENGNFGNCKPLKNKLAEIKIDFGPGYRIYYSKLRNNILIILNGAEKTKRQNKDILCAQEFLKDWKGRNHD